MLYFKNLFPTLESKLRERESKKLHFNFLLKSVFSVLFVILFFFLFNASAYAATYYVDPNITDISTASATPDYTTYNHTTFAVTGGTDSVYKTIADINASTFSPGDSILFKRGGTWREQLTVPSSGTSGSPITFGAYGSGNNPLIIRSNIYSNWWEHSLIGNGGFERLDSGTIGDGLTDTFTLWSNRIDASNIIEAVGGAHSGDVAAKLTRSGGTTDWIFQAINIVPNTTYYVEFYGKKDAGSGDGYVMIKDYTNNLTLQNNGTWSSTVNYLGPLEVSETTWTKKTLTFTTSSSASADFEFRYYNNGTGSDYLDDVYIIQGATKSSTRVWGGYISPVRNVFGILDNGARALQYTQETNINPLTMTDGYFYGKLNTPTFYYRKDSGFPSSTEVGVRQFGITVSNKSYVTIDGIDVYGPGGNNNNGYNNHFGIDVSSSSHDITVKNSTISFADNVGISSDNTTSNITYDTITTHDNQTTGIYMDSNGGSITGSKSYNNGKVITDTGDGGGIGIYQGQGITVSGNEVYNNGRSDANADMEISVVGSPGSVNITKNYIHDCLQGCVQIAEGGNGSTISYNLINGFGTSTDSGETYGHHSGIRIGGGASGSANVKIYNNVIANGSSTAGNQRSGIAIEMAESTGTLIKNNIFYNNGIPDISVNSNVTDTSGHNYNNNLFYRSDYTNAWNWKGTNYSSLATWKSASSQDSNSLASDPLFVNASGNDFHLTSLSPAINAGVDVGLTTDYAGVSVPQGSAPDIGAYEYLLPLSASSLAQYQSDGITSIPLGTTLGIASGVILKFSMSSTNPSDTLTPQVEIQRQGIAFTNTPTNTGSALSFTGTPVTGTVTIPSMGGGNYHWQARVINSAGQSSWVAMGGNPDFGVEFPPAANNSSAPSGCSNQQPSSSPDLFQIDTTNTKATVYFAPSGMPYDNYVIRFGPTANNLLYSASFTRGYAPGVIYYTINELSPNTIYYFQVRAGNGCKPGSWGNTLSAKTTGSINSTSKSYESLGGFIRSLVSFFSSKYTGSAINTYVPTPTPTIVNNNTPGQCTKYTVQLGDSFWTIAQKLLGSGQRYMEIWKANINTYPTLKNSSVIRAGWKLSVGC